MSDATPTGSDEPAPLQYQIVRFPDGELMMKTTPCDLAGLFISGELCSGVGGCEIFLDAAELVDFPGGGEWKWRGNQLGVTLSWGTAVFFDDYNEDRREGHGWCEFRLADVVRAVREWMALLDPTTGRFPPPGDTPS